MQISNFFAQNSPYRQETLVLLLLLFLTLTHSAFSAFVGVSGILYVLLVGSAAAIAFVYPRSGLLAVLITTVIFERFFTLLPLVWGESTYKIYPLDIILVASFFGAIIFTLSNRYRGNFLRKKSDWWFLFFWLYVCGLGGASLIFFSESSLATVVSTTKQYAFYPLMILLLPMLLRTWEDMKWFSSVLFLSIFSTGFFLFIGIVLGGGLWTEYTPLTTSGVRLVAFPHGFYAALALLVTLFSYPFFRKESGRSERWYMVGGLFALVTLASLMRHIWLALGVVIFGALMYTFVTGYARNFSIALAGYFVRLAVPVVLLFSLLWFGVSLFPDSHAAFASRKVVSVVQDRVSSIGNQYDESLVWRTVVWEQAFNRFAKQPLSGIGFGQNVPVELGEYQTFVEVRDMHNSWLALLIQTGIIGVVLFAGFLFSLLFPLWQQRKEGSWTQVVFILVALTAFQSLVFLSQPYLETNLLGIFYWVTLGLIRTLIGLSEEEKTVVSL